MFESPDAAAFAQSYLTEHVHVHPERLAVFDASAPDAAARIAASLPAAYHDDAQQALAAGRSVLIVTVDETEAFKTRELLDEETRSLKTVVVPPAAAPGWQGVSADIAAANEHGAPARVTPGHGLSRGTSSAT